MLTMFNQNINSSTLCITMIDHCGNTEVVLSFLVITPAYNAYTLIRMKDITK